MTKSNNAFEYTLPRIVLALYGESARQNIIGTRQQQMENEDSNQQANELISFKTRSRREQTKPSPSWNETAIIPRGLKREGREAE